MGSLLKTMSFGVFPSLSGGPFSRFLDSNSIYLTELNKCLQNNTTIERSTSGSKGH